jgi:CBS domain-containing protein
MVRYGVRVVPLAHEVDLALEGLVYRSNLLRASSTLVQSLTALELAEDPKVVAHPEDRLVDVVDALLEADEWYAVVSTGRSYRGVLGFEHVLAYALTREPRLRKALEKPLADVAARVSATARPSDPVHRVWQTMMSRKLTALPVVDESGRLVGVVTEHDLLRAGFARPRLEARKSARGPQVRSIMSTPPVALSPESTVLDAVRLIVRRGIGRVYVVDDDGKLLGVVDRRDATHLLTPVLRSL